MNKQFGLLDTSVIVDLFDIPASSLPNQSVISALTLAELTSGITASVDLSRVHIHIGQLLKQ